MTAQPDHIGKRNRRGGADITFDPKAHSDWVNGFGKRKKERRKNAEKNLIDKARRQKLSARSKKRVEMHDAYKDIVGHDFNEEEGDKTKEAPELVEHLRPFEGTTEYTEGTQVVIQAISMGNGPEALEESEEEAADPVLDKLGSVFAKPVGGTKSASKPAGKSKAALALLPVKKGKAARGKFTHSKGAGGVKKKKNLFLNTNKKHKGKT